MQNFTSFHLVLLKSIVVSMIVIFSVAPVLAQHDHGESRQHSAHEHGVANLNLVFQDSDLQIELLLPAADISGFEHAPKTKEEKQRDAESIKLLEGVKNVLALTDAAKCELGSVKVVNSANESHDHGHSEYRAVYKFSCAKPMSLKKVDIEIFKSLTTLTKIRANTVVAGKQKQLTLSKEQSSISFEQR